MTSPTTSPRTPLDRAFDELAAFECEFDVADFHLYVHDHGRRLDADPLLPAAHGYLTAMAGVVDRVQARLPACGSNSRGSTTPMRMQEHYAGSKAGQRCPAP